MKEQSHVKVHLVSLGCPKNLVDSENILGALGASGIAISSSPEDCDIIIINSCGFIKPALRETEDEIQKAIQSSDSQGKKIYVYGCAVNRFRNELDSRYPLISGWFRLEERERLLNAIRTGAANRSARLPTTYGYAYLKIAEGCSNHCSYCTIPSIKGEYRSFDMDTLVKETTELSKLGIKEIILVAQDTTRYGLDIYGKPKLVSLIRRISDIEAIEWIRILYAHPKGLSHDILSEIASNRKVCKYIDMPIQHVADRILTLMNRGVTKHQIKALIRQLRNIKRMSLRTTVIAGFPSETGDEFKELLGFLREVRFDWLGVFPYYPEKGTEAAQLEQLPEPTIRKRHKTIIALQNKLVHTKNSQRVGQVYRTLIHWRDRSSIGHTEFAAPDVDGHVITNANHLEVGNYYNLRITRVTGSDLHAKIDQEH